MGHNPMPLHPLPMGNGALEKGRFNLHISGVFAGHRAANMWQQPRGIFVIWALGAGRWAFGGADLATDQYVLKSTKRQDQCQINKGQPGM